MWINRTNHTILICLHTKSTTNHLLSGQQSVGHELSDSQSELLVAFISLGVVGREREERN